MKRPILVQTMILLQAILCWVAFTTTTTTMAFTVVRRSRCLSSSSFRPATAAPSRPRTARHSSSSSNNINDDDMMQVDLHQFDEWLQEGGQQTTTAASSSGGRRIALTDSQDTHGRVILASSTTFPGGENAFLQQQEEEAAAANGDDPYASAFDSQMGKIEQYQDQQKGTGSTTSLEQKFKSMDFQDIVLMVVIPGLIAFAAGRWVFNRVGGRVSENADETLDSFAREMIYHDGDFTEMELCVNDYKTKLVWMGPTRNDSLLKRYLAEYARKKTVSPQAIASLSHVFTMFKLTEEKAARLLVQLCKELGTEKISSAGKLLFLGSRILKTPEGVRALQPIKDLIMTTYREESVAETMIETSQQAIAEAAYRSAVLAAGKNQSGLTAGWEVLGLERETATRIFQDEREEGFVSDRETMYGGQTRKYDKSGHQIDAEGKKVNPEDGENEYEDDDDDEELEMTSNVFECGNCGFTLFVAEGREDKFFGPGFKCPECGAPKSDFKARGDEDD